MILSDVHFTRWHMGCLSRQSEEIPAQEWLCPICIKDARHSKHKSWIYLAYSLYLIMEVFKGFANVKRASM